MAKWGKIGSPKSPKRKKFMAKIRKLRNPQFFPHRFNAESGGTNSMGFFNPVSPIKHRRTTHRK